MLLWFTNPITDTKLFGHSNHLLKNEIRLLFCRRERFYGEFIEFRKKNLKLTCKLKNHIFELGYDNISTPLTDKYFSSINIFLLKLINHSFTSNYLFFWYFLIYILFWMNTGPWYSGTTGYGRSAHMSGCGNHPFRLLSIIFSIISIISIE